MSWTYREETCTAKVRQNTSERPLYSSGAVWQESYGDLKAIHLQASVGEHDSGTVHGEQGCSEICRLMKITLMVPVSRVAS